MRILLFGKNGQVGWELQRSLALKGEVIALDRYSAKYCGNLENTELLYTTILNVKPDIVFNAAAYTAVDKAESEREKAFLVNSLAVKAIALGCKKTNSLLVHYSTDYIFDGSGNQPRDENAITSPLNIYGKSKLNGELEILRSGCKHLIFRTSWVYGVHGKNFIKTIIKLAKTKTELNVVNDQIGTPTSADFISDVSTEIALRCLQNNKGNVVEGIYNLVPDGFTSWYDFAVWIVSRYTEKHSDLCLGPNNIAPIPSKEYSTPATRPLNSRLNNSKIKNIFLAGIKDWDYYASRMIDCL